MSWPTTINDIETMRKQIEDLRGYLESGQAVRRRAGGCRCPGRGTACRSGRPHAADARGQRCQVVPRSDPDLPEADVAVGRDRTRAPATSRVESTSLRRRRSTRSTICSRNAAPGGAARLRAPEGSGDPGLQQAPDGERHRSDSRARAPREDVASKERRPVAAAPDAPGRRTGAATREIGVRAALGANPGAIVGLVLRQGFAMAFGGLAVGPALSFVFAKSPSSVLYGVAAHDFISFATVALFLSIVVAAATVVPARRAATMDPVRALKGLQPVRRRPNRHAAPVNSR
jgi:hypothetical protein